MGDVTNTPHTAGEAVARSRSRDAWTTDMCMEHVWWSLNGEYKYGLPDALAGWARTELRRTDRTPPAGAPVYWTSSRQPHGHVALSVGGGRVRSTDWPSRGRLGEVAIGELERAWGLTWLGYGLDLAGERIAGIAPSPTISEDTMTPEQLRQVLDAIANVPRRTWTYPLVNRITRKAWSAGSYVEGGGTWAADAKRDSAKALAELAALRSAVAALAARPGITAEQVLDAAKAGADAALSDRITDATVTLEVSAPEPEETAP